MTLIDAAPPRSATSRLRRSGLSKGLIVFAAFCGFLVLFFVIFGPVIIGQDAYQTNIDSIRSGPSAQHWLGTDDLGRDIAARLAVGGRVDLVVAFVAITISTVIAMLIGIVTGFYGGIFDLIVIRVVDTFHAIPSLIIALGIVALLGPSASTVVLAVGLSYWTGYTRLIRAEVVDIRSRPYIDAARVVGMSSLRVIVKDVLPALWPLILVNSTSIVGGAILSAASLGFLGLGIQPPEASWGAMLAESRNTLLTRPEVGLIASVPIILSVIAVNVLSDVLQRRFERDAVAV